MSAMHRRIGALYRRSQRVLPDARIHAALLDAADAASVQVAVDESDGVGGAGLRRVLDAVRASKLEALVVWRVSDLGATTSELAERLLLLYSAQIELIVVGKGVVLEPRDQPYFEFIVHLLHEVIHAGHVEHTERTRAGLARARQAGKRLGRPPRK